MRRFGDLMTAHKKASFGLWILVLVGVAAGQWQFIGGNGILTEVLGASTKKVDTTPPVVSISFPVGGGAYGANSWLGCSPAGVCGTATDDVSVAKVEVSILQPSSGKYWDGTNFTAASTPSWRTASLSKSSWTFPFAVPADEGSYSVSARATDTSTNVSQLAAASFTVDRTAPASPSIDQRPDSVTSQTTATFAFRDSDITARFQCQLDGAAFAACVSPVSYSKLAAGDHSFGVRAVDPAGNQGPATSAAWTIASGNFTISGDVATPLYPGMGPAPVNVTFTNPYNFTLNITNVQVAVQQATFLGTTPNTACVGPTNLAVDQATINWTISVPANSTRSLQDTLTSAAPIPVEQWPHVHMVNLPTNQDGCKNTTFKLAYSATGSK